MVKSANPWLRGLMRAGKKQQRSVTRALTVLLAPPKPAPKPKAKPKPKPAVKARAAAKPAALKKTTALTKPSPKTGAPATGKWLASYLAAAPEHGAGPARRMSYWLYIPDVQPGPEGLPLVVMLHGCDQSATQFAQGTRMNQWAEKQGYAVIYPQQSVSAHPHRCWKWYDRATQHGGGDVRLIVGIVEKVMARYAIDRTRMYIAGISAGAGMANIVALNHPDMFAAVGLHSGPLFGAGHSQLGALGVMKHGDTYRVDRAIEEVLESRPAFPSMPTLLIQGDEDHIVRPVNQVQLTRQAMLLNRLPHGSPVSMADKAASGGSLPYRLHDVHHGSSLMLRVAQIAGLQHAWSGGDDRVSYSSGPGPDASRMMLDFFSRHRRDV